MLAMLTVLGVGMEPSDFDPVSILVSTSESGTGPSADGSRLVIDGLVSGPLEFKA